MSSTALEFAPDHPKARLAHAESKRLCSEMLVSIRYLKNGKRFTRKDAVLVAGRREEHAAAYLSVHGTLSGFYRPSDTCRHCYRDAMGGVCLEDCRTAREAGATASMQSMAPVIAQILAVRS